MITIIIDMLSNLPTNFVTKLPHEVVLVQSFAETKDDSHYIFISMHVSKLHLHEFHNQFNRPNRFIKEEKLKQNKLKVYQKEQIINISHVKNFKGSITIYIDRQMFQGLWHPIHQGKAHLLRKLEAVQTILVCLSIFNQFIFTM